MEKIFETLEKNSSNYTPNELSEEVTKFVSYLIDNVDYALFDMGKTWKSYGTWESTCFINNFHYGDILTEILTKALSGRLTHDEKKVFFIEDFRTKIEEEIFEYLFHKQIIL